MKPRRKETAEQQKRGDQHRDRSRKSDVVGTSRGSQRRESTGEDGGCGGIGCNDQEARGADDREGDKG